MRISKKYAIGLGVVGILSVGIWVLSSVIVSSSSPSVPSSSVSSSPRGSSGGRVSSRSTSVLGRYSGSGLRDYSARVDDYLYSIKTFNSFYKLNNVDLSEPSISNSKDYFVIVSFSDGLDNYVLNPSGSVVGYFSKDYSDENNKEFKGFTRYKDESTNLEGVLALNFASELKYSDINTEVEEDGYKLMNYPINKELLEDISDYKSVKDVTFSISSARTPVKYRLYENSKGDKVLVSQYNMLTGMPSSERWKKEVFNRGGSGTEIEIKGSKLWVY